MPNQFDTNLLPASTDTYDVGSAAQRWNNVYAKILRIVSHVFSGSTSGTTTLQASAIASGTLTLPAATDTLVGKATIDTLTNKTLTSPILTTPSLGVAVGTSLALSGGTALATTNQTGTGSIVMSTSPALTTPALGAATATSLAIGSGTVVTKIVVYSQALTPVSVLANTTAEDTFAVTGLTTADKIIGINGPLPIAGTFMGACRASAADQLKILFGNCTAGPLTPAAGTYQIVALRS